jgi:hypothetical protein
VAILNAGIEGTRQPLPNRILSRDYSVGKAILDPQAEILLRIGTK